MNRSKPSYRCDVRFPGIGRIAKATGATQRKEYDRRVAILHELYDAGRWDVLEAIRDGRFTIREVVAARRADRLDRLWGELTLNQPLAETVEAWLPESAPAAATRTRYKVSWGELQRSGALPPNARIRDLAAADWKALKGHWPGGAHDWKHLRGFVSRFLTAILGDVHHPFRRHVMDRGNFPLASTTHRVPDCTPEAFWKVVAEMPEHVRAIPVALLATGMRIGELCACDETNLLPLTHQVRIPGRTLHTSEFKSDAVTQPVDPRLWSWVERAIPVPLSHWRVRELWRRACRKAGVTDLTLHDLRHLYGQWLINAGRSEESVQRSMRHRTADMTRLYTTQRDRQTNAVVIADVLLGFHGLTHTEGSASDRSA